MSFHEEFLKAIQSLEPLVDPEIEYRIHYDADGNITMCTQTDHPDNTQYLVVTKEQYQHYYLYKIKDNQLILLDNGNKNHVQLKKSDHGYRTVRNHAGIVLSINEEYKDVEFYE